MVVQNPARATHPARAFIDVQGMPLAEPDVEASDGVTVLRQPKEIAGGGLQGTAVLDVRVGKIAAFEIDSELLRGRGRASR